ncbi:hypothetical protein [uncultured Vibrio sp.]|uniref:hypothetical protein n=1 Tax=uncultured Vibrio sp. TaxID=114054 RepID=UPI0025DB13FE|nr:hypothetical protein [uncultured Vibrio sp.]
MTCVIDNTTHLTIDEVSCDYHVLTPAEYNQLVEVISSGAISIDSSLYVTVSGWLLASFVSGHVLGRIIKGLSKG